MATTKKTIIEIGGKKLAVTNLDKVLFPKDRITKGDLIAYYRAVAPYILPYVEKRPLTLERFPDGIGKAGWWEKQIPRGLPEWVPTVKVRTEYGRHAGGHVEFIVCNDEATLAYVANLAAITLHVWTSREPKLDNPDFLLIDLDRGEGCTLATLCAVALLFRDAVRELGLEPLVRRRAAAACIWSSLSSRAMTTTSLRGSRSCSRAGFMRKHPMRRRCNGRSQNAPKVRHISTTNRSAGGKPSYRRSRCGLGTELRCRFPYRGNTSRRSGANASPIRQTNGRAGMSRRCRRCCARTAIPGKDFGAGNGSNGRYKKHESCGSEQWHTQSGRAQSTSDS